jgi:hypothetical protein
MEMTLEEAQVLLNAKRLEQKNTPDINDWLERLEMIGYLRGYITATCESRNLDKHTYLAELQ